MSNPTRRLVFLLATSGALLPLLGLATGSGLLSFREHEALHDVHPYRTCCFGLLEFEDKQAAQRLAAHQQAVEKRIARLKTLTLGIANPNLLRLRLLALQGIDLALITARSSAIVERRAAELGITHIYQGRLRKLDAFADLLSATGLAPGQVCYAGDDWLDIPVLDRVGLAVTVPDADSVVKDHAHWITPRPGGHGAVRDLCDLILAARGLDQLVLDQILGA